MKKKVLILSGITGIGKGHLAPKIAKTLNGEVMVCDSVKIFKQLKIGSNMAPFQYQLGIKHHLHSFQNLEDNFSSGDYAEAAKSKILQLHQEDKIPIISGGCGFYLRTLLYGQNENPKAPVKILNEMTVDLRKMGWKSALMKLQIHNPEYAKRIEFNNYNLLARAIWIVETTGKPIPPLKKKNFYNDLEFDYRFIFLYENRATTQEKISNRCDRIIENGLFEETYPLFCEGLLSEDSMGGKSIGYHQVIQFIKRNRGNGRIPRVEFYRFLKEFRDKSRGYARRQLTWFRKQEGVAWVDIENLNEEQTEMSVLELFRKEPEEYKQYVESSKNLQSKMETKLEKVTFKTLKEKRNHFKQLNTQGIYHSPARLFDRLRKLEQLNKKWNLKYYQS